MDREHEGTAPDAGPVVTRGAAATARGWDWRPLAAHRAVPRLRASVVVVHHEQPEQLARCLAAVAAARSELDELEVVVADDGSARPPDVPAAARLVRAPHDTTFRAATARNAGIAASTLPVVVLLDADVVPQPGALAALVRAAAVCDHVLVAGTRRHAALDGLAPAEAVALLAAPDPDAAVRAAGRRLPDPAWGDARAARTDALTRPDPHAHRAVLSAAMACSRGLLDDLGGFDEGFVGYGGEDWDLSARAVADGALLARPGAAVVWHDGPDVGGRGWSAAAARRQRDRLAPLVPDAALRAGRVGWEVAAVDVVHDVTDLDEDVLAALAAAADAVAGHDVGVRVVGPGAPRAAAELAGRVTAGDPDAARRRGWLRLDVPDLRIVTGEVVARVAALVDEHELGRLVLGPGDGGRPLLATRSHARQRLARLGAGLDDGTLLAKVFPTAALPLAAVLDAAPVPRDVVAASWAGATGGADAPPDDRPVFVLGAGPGSGADVVQRLCTSAPGVHVWDAPAHAAVLAALPGMAAGHTPAVLPDCGDRGGPTRADLPPVTLLAAQRAMLRTLLAHGPAARPSRWGCVDDRLDAGHAAWLRLLYPACTVVQVVRDPWAAWCAHHAPPGSREHDLRRRVPQDDAPCWPVRSAAAFGRGWARQAGSFLDDGPRLLLRLEDLRDPATVDRLDAALGAPVDRSLLDRVPDGAAATRARLTARTRELLAVAAGPVAERLGYPLPPLAGTMPPVA